LTEGKIRVPSCVCSTFDAGKNVRMCICLYTHIRTHTAHGVLDVSPWVGTRHLGGPKNPDALNLGLYVFVYGYKVHMIDVDFITA